MIWASLIALHILGAIIWIGGMAFMLLALHPSLGTLAGTDRVTLMGNVFRHFFRYVWVSIAALLISGYALVFGMFDGFAGAPLYVHVMQGIGLLMAALFGWLYFMPYQAFRFAAANQDPAAASRAAARIRHVAMINLIIGLIVAVVGSAGRFMVL